MIGKHFKVKSFNDVLHYVLDKSGAVLLNGNLCSLTASDLSTEFSQVQALRPSISQPVYHCAISLSLGEYLENDQWRDVGDRYLREMGFLQSPYILVRHTDTGERDHVHIVASRIRFDGSVVSDSWDHRRAENILRGLEADYHLTPVEPSWQSNRRARTRRQFEAEKESLGESVQLKLQRLLDQELQHAFDLQMLCDRLLRAGVSTRIRCDKQGAPQGISFHVDGVALAGSHLGRSYTLPQIMKRMNSVEDQHILETAVRARKQIELAVTTTLSEFVEDWQDYMNRLSQWGILVHLQYSTQQRDRKRRIRGISYSMGEVGFSGEDLAQQCSFKAVQHLVNDGVFIKEFDPLSDPLQREILSVVPPAAEAPQIQESGEISIYQRLYERLAQRFPDDRAIAHFISQHGGESDLQALAYSPAASQWVEQGRRFEDFLQKLLLEQDKSARKGFENLG